MASTGFFSRIAQFPFPGRERVSQVFSASLLQLVVMGLNFLSSILILRFLDKSQYGLYTIFYTMLAALQLMSNSNLTIGLSTIGGRMYQDTEAFSRLILTANRLRRGLALFTAPAIILYTVLLLHFQEYFAPGELAKYSLYLGLLSVASIPDLLGLFYSHCLLLVGKFKEYYVSQIIQAVIKLMAAAALFWVVGTEGSRLYILLGFVGLSNWAWYWYTARSTRSFYRPAGLEPDPDMRQELISYPKRTWHNTLFYVFQGQIGLVLLALAGTQESVADLGALGRFAVINTLFLSVAGALFFPRYAKLVEYSTLKSNYLTAVIFGLVAGSVLVLSAVLFPDLYLLLLGPQYSELRIELILAITMGGLSLLNGILHGLNNARGWIKYVPKFGIPSYLIPFLIGLYFLEIGTVRGILQLYLLIELGHLTVEVFSGLAGLRETKSQQENE